jgi:hypothetical protein
MQLAEAVELHEETEAHKHENLLAWPKVRVPRG